MSCKVEIDGTSYYIPCDRVKDLEVIDGFLVNVSSSSVTLKNSFSTENTTYPYISCNSNQVCRLYTQSGQTWESVRSEAVYNGDYFKILDYDFVITFLLFIILGVRLVWKK